MISMLNDAEIKLIKIVSKVLLAISLLLLVPSVWLILFGEMYKEPIMYFPVILSISFLANIYRVSKTLKIQGGSISRFQLKCRLLALSRSMFVSWSYICVVISNVFLSILSVLLSIITLICEFIIKNDRCEKM